MASLNQVNNMDESVLKTEICPGCGSADYAKSGYWKSKRLGKIQRVQCRNCKRRYALRWRIARNKAFDEKTLNLVIHLSYFKLSSHKIREILMNYIGVKINHYTILKWIKEFGNPNYKKTFKQFMQQIEEEHHEQMPILQKVNLK